MNITDYYQVISSDNQLIHVKLSGFWSSHDGDSIYTGAMSLWKRAVDRQLGRRYIVLVDFTDCPVLSEVTKRFLADAIRYSKQHNLYKAVQYGMAAIAKMGVNASAQKTGHTSTRIAVATRAEAMVLINELKKDLALGSSTAA